jgi:stringent starvation protein B
MPRMESPPRSKREILERLLDRGMVMVTLDARRPGVDVPSRFQEEPQLRLNLSHRFGQPMDVNDWGVHATLTFSGVPHACKLPWSAIYQMISHVTAEQYPFPEDVPEEVVRSAVDARQERPSGRPRPRLSLVQDDDENLPAVVPDEPAAEDEPPPDSTPPSGAPGRAHLRRIK